MWQLDTQHAGHDVHSVMCLVWHIREAQYFTGHKRDTVDAAHLLELRVDPGNVAGWFHVWVAADFDGMRCEINEFHLRCLHF